MLSLIQKIFGSKHERDIKRLRPKIEEINTYFNKYRRLSDRDLIAKTEEFKQQLDSAASDIRSRMLDIRFQLAGDVSDGESADIRDDLRAELDELVQEELKQIEDVLNEILPQAFAVIKETSRRFAGATWKVCDQNVLWDMIPFDVQLIGGMVLHEGKITEMATGEGKTLVATMPIYLNALSGKGVHLVTVNDYLARRDSEWMGRLFEFMGLSVAFLANDMDPHARNHVYAADVIYGTNNEFGFDYLRDNMAIQSQDRVQREHNYTIIDEVDSVLIDEARTPLIISGPVEKSTQQFAEMKPLVQSIVGKQMRLVNSIMADAKKALQEKDEYEAGFKLLQVQRGAPKNKQLQKLYHEPGIKKMIQAVENEFMRDKRMGEVDEDLFYSIDEKSHIIDLTEKGRLSISPSDKNMFVLPDLSIELHQIDEDAGLNEEEKLLKKDELHQQYGIISERIHNISQLLRAFSLYEKDVEYVVDGGKVIIVDEFTGRLMPGRRFSDGLHQALEAKEGVKIERETQTLATITIQNYFRLYNKLAGMTGTAETESTEFWQIYNLDVVVIPTNEPIRREDYEDQIYRTKREKYNAVIDEIERLHKAGRPILVGTVTVDSSELLSRMLKRRGIKHEVLNAKNHQKEAEIVMKAGQPGQVTIATNMAGRGTDIKLGAGVVQRDETGDFAPSEVPWGLQIIGTERHEARRIDRQLRGRSGRQGDPGASRFFLSLEDDLMRLFGSDRVSNVMDRIGVEDGEVIAHSMITKSIERAQRRVEMRNFEIRKHLLEYDDVMNQQREVIYDRRNHALEGENLQDEVLDTLSNWVNSTVDDAVAVDGYAENWDWERLQERVQRILLIELPVSDDEQASIKEEELRDRLQKAARDVYRRKEKALGQNLMRRLERYVFLRVIDNHWRDHLYEMDHLKEGINLRAYGQKDPLMEYKAEGYKLFAEMLGQIDEEVIGDLFRARLEEPKRTARKPSKMQTTHQSTAGMGFAGAGGAPQKKDAPEKAKTVVREMPKVGRNDPCPCGSGKKYKQCHGK